MVLSEQLGSRGTHLCAYGEVNQVKDSRVDSPELSFPSMGSPEHPNDASMNEEPASKFDSEFVFRDPSVLGWRMRAPPTC